MFDSGIKASELIADIQSEADIAIDIPDENYIAWLNSLEQLLYREVIKEQAEVDADVPDSGVISLNRVNVNVQNALDEDEYEGLIRFEDIHAIYAGTTQLIKSTVASGVIFPDTYYKVDNDIGINVDSAPEKVKIVYFVKPALKSSSTSNKLNVMLPIEFIDLAKAKLRGEAYKLANEGELAAMWLNDYNILLETFKAWIADKQPAFGL